MKIIYTGLKREELEPGKVYTATETPLGYEVRIADKKYGVMPDEAEVVKDERWPISMKELDELVKKKLKKDPINPSHYTGGGIEVWEMMVKLFGEEGFMTYCEINAFKYRMRAGKKEGNSAEQDIKKALWYEDKLNEIKRKKSLDDTFKY